MNRLHPKPHWTLRDRVVTAFVVCWLAFHILVPLTQLLHDVNPRFAWQMYAKGPVTASVLWLGAAGDTVAASAAMERRWYGDSVWGRAAGSSLCRRQSGAQSVVVVFTFPPASSYEHRCQP